MGAITVLDAAGNTLAMPQAAVESIGRGVVMTGTGGTVSAVAKRRVEADEAALRAIFGDKKIDRMEPIYERGTRVNSTGEANFKKIRREMEKMPTADVAAMSTYQAIRTEGRTDMDIDLSLAEPGDVPGTVALNGELFSLTPTAWEHFFQHANAPKYAAAHAAHAKPSVRDAMLREYRSDSKRLVAAYRTGAVAGVNGQRALPAGVAGEIYRVASERYTAVDCDQVLATQLVTSHDLMRGWHGEIAYDGERMTFDMLQMPDTVIDLSAGDVFKIGLRLRANDVREGGISAELIAWRNLCLNLIVIGQANVEIFNARHMGSAQDIHIGIAGIMAQAEVAFGHFRHQWGQARSEKVITSALPADRFFEGLAHSKMLSLPGDTGAVKSMLFNAWMEEPAFDRASVVNAVTRAAHEGAVYRDAFTIGKVEAEAGKLLTDTRLVSKVESALADLDSKRKPARA